MDQLRAEITDLKARVEALETGQQPPLFYPDLPVDPEHQATIQIGMQFGHELARRLAQRKAVHTAMQAEQGEYPHPPENWAEEVAAIYQEIVAEMTAQRAEEQAATSDTRRGPMSVR
jgi:hypothetical protein